MTLALGSLLLLLGLGYVAYLWRFALGFRATARESAPAPEASSDAITVSVIVAARNEEASIGACVDAILANDYPQERFEVIVADDDSSDRTADVVRAVQKRVHTRSV
ncbi:MAG: glycosyltransferase, partial [Bacteroidota bacterium]